MKKRDVKSEEKEKCTKKKPYRSLGWGGAEKVWQSVGELGGHEKASAWGKNVSVSHALQVSES